MTLAPATAKKLARLAAREQKARDAAYAAADEFRAAVKEAHDAGGSLREIGSASGRSWARIHQIVRPKK